MWFEKLVGFREKNAEQVRKNIIVDGETMVSRVNDQRLQCGQLEIPSLAELRSRSATADNTGPRARFREVVADVQSLHQDPNNAGAFFQVASQFNLLEMISPLRTPEDGVTIYEMDRTQGPACAIACGAGTIFRNYFANVGGTVGQSELRQIDCLSDVGNELVNKEGRLWEMRNGYALATKAGLIEITEQLAGADDSRRDRIRRALRVGIQSRTQVTLGRHSHAVTQLFGSALPVAYSKHSDSSWQAFARLILEASYEATLHAAAINYQETGNNKVYLTLLGGGAFGNPYRWIFDAIRRTRELRIGNGLEIAIVSYGQSDPRLCQFIKSEL